MHHAASATLQPMQLNLELAGYFDAFAKDLHVEAQHTLLRAGDVARNLYLLRTGALRLCVRSAQGDETSVQFFFEGDMVSSLESMLSGHPSGMELITMEACHLRALDRVTVLAQARSHPALQTQLLALTQQRLIDYVKLYTSAITQTPEQRYLDMLATQGERLTRIPMHVLAGYLGITPVHLSRIRRKLKANSRLQPS
jgi:CRP-like cAMP-binding protein